MVDQRQNIPAGEPGTAPDKGASAADKKLMSVKDAVATAMRFYNTGKLKDAKNLAQQIVTARPGNADAHNILGVVKYQEGDTEGGIRSVREAIRLNPTSANFLYFEVDEDADSFSKRMQAEGVIVRSLVPWGIPNGIRVSIGTPEQNERLVKVLKKIGRQAAIR